jgi:putative glutamine amidotransferase
MKKILSHAMIILLAAVLFSCSGEQQVTVAISKATPNYIAWLKKADSTVNYINLYTLTTDSALKVLASCSGLLVTGGEDVYPAWYGKEYDTARCTGFDRRRDTLEIALIREAFRVRMPVFGICRGEQIINVALGGTLIVDVPSDYPHAVIHQCEDYLSCRHAAIPVQGTLLKTVSGCDSALVATNHHQAAEHLAPPLRVDARAPDGLTEGIEWADPEGKSFLLAVQWHPERMDVTNPLSAPLASAFLAQCLKYAPLNQH